MKSKNSKKSTEESIEKISEKVQKSPPVQYEHIEESFFDLRTTHGQILFLLVAISLSILVQLLPNDSLKYLINYRMDPTTLQINKITEHCNKTIQNDVIKIPKYILYGNSQNDNHLRHVKAVLNRLGYDQTTNLTSDWDLMWAHDYPFRTLYPKLHQMKSHQRVNHFPACGFITNKVDLSTSDLKYIPKAFRLPEDREKFENYAKENPKKLFVQKHNQHRHICIKSIDEIDFNDNNTFIQEFIDKPLLVDGHKFDIGVYVIITSVDPLRVYIYKGDILFRFCPAKYYPFDVKNIDKYIVGDDYLPTWDVPSLSPFYNGLGFGMKDSFDAYVKSKGQDPNGIWIQVEDAIRIAILSKERHLANALKNFPEKRNFFEMMRFDLVVDENLKVFLMEANMSPNLSSAHYLPNMLLYEQVIFNLLNLVGVGSSIHRESLRKRASDVESMMSSDKNIAVFADDCTSDECSISCESLKCQLCRPCLSHKDITNLHIAYREHINRGDTKRIFPKPIDKNYVINDKELENLTDENKKMTKWFIGKCLMDRSWCI